MAGDQHPSSWHIDAGPRWCYNCVHSQSNHADPNEPKERAGKLFSVDSGIAIWASMDELANGGRWNFGRVLGQHALDAWENACMFIPVQ